MVYIKRYIIIIDYRCIGINENMLLFGAEMGFFGVFVYWVVLDIR